MKKQLLGLCLSLIILSPGALHAQIGLGGQLSWADDADLGIGARGTLGVPTQIGQLEVIAALDYFFPDQVAGIDVSYWELNTNLVYMFRVPTPVVAPYAGAGLNFAHASVSTDLPGVGFSDTELGLNLLGGAKFNVGSVTPFAELRLELDGGEQFVITGGALFTVGPGI
jgi:hypothetical protein